MKKVFIIDDNLVLLKLYEKILTRAGYEVGLLQNSAEYDNGDLKAFEPDLIILETSMDHLDGYSLLERLKENDLCVDSKKMMCSAKVLFEQDKKIAIDLGVDGFVVKPFDASTLIEAVKAKIGI